MDEGPKGPTHKVERGPVSEGSDLASVIDAVAIQSLIEDFYQLTGMPAAIIDIEGAVIAGAGWQRVCLDFHRANPDTCKNCIESDTVLTTGVPEGEFKLYKCKNNMWDVSTPLVIGGRHVGNVFSGQFFFDDEPVEEDLFRGQAVRYGFDECAYLQALKEVPRLSRETVRVGMLYLAKSARLFSLLSYRTTELARLTSELRHSEDRLKRAQSIAHIGSWELDLIANNLSWSDEVYAIFGLEPQAFGATYEAFLSFVHPEDRAAVDEAYSGSIREGRASYEITHRIIRGRSSEVRWVHEKCEHFRDEAGRIVRSVGMVQDITERHEAEEHLRHKQKLESIGLLAAGIAHDFNNLLVGVLGNASLAQEMLDPKHPVIELLDGIAKSSRRASDLTRQMLAYAGKGQFAVERFDFSALVQEMTSLLAGSIPGKVSLDLQLQSKLPLIEADRGQIQQVIMNLLINAVEAIGDDAGSILVRTRLGDPTAVLGHRKPHSGPWIRFEVADSGCGMDLATQAKIFDPFFTTKFDGRGLGLAAVAGILRGHNAHVHVDSAPGKGTRFTIHFPAVEDNGQQPVEPCRLELASGTETVLVVDDEEHIRKLVLRSLERDGYSVLVAASGAEAIRACIEYPDKIDVVLLDSSMPGLSGEETLPELIRLRPDLRVILSSGYGRDETLSRYAGQQVATFIQKPYALNQLRETIRAVTGSISTLPPVE